VALYIVDQTLPSERGVTQEIWFLRAYTISQIPSVGVVRLMEGDNEHWTVTECSKDNNKPPKHNSYTANAKKTDKIPRS
jgi:hypothetical protein